MPNSTRQWLRPVIHVGAWVSLAWLLWRAGPGDLGTNPVETITHVTGKTALILLVLSLACTPVNTVFGFRQVLTVRRALGLYAFGYAVLHLLTVVGIDYGFDLAFMREDALLEKPFILVGLAAVLILLPLAATSTKGWMRRLGRSWKRLHRLVYVAGVLVAIHFAWVAKALTLESVLVAAVVALLLVLRVPLVRRAVSHARASS